MAFLSRKSAAIYVTAESVEGTAVDPSVDDDSISVNVDGFEVNGDKELVERNVLRSSIGKVNGRTSIKTSSISLSMEAAANIVEGSAPENDLLLKSLLGGKRQITVEVTSGVGSTASVINIDDADIGNFNRGDIVVIKEAGAYHVSPISEVDSSVGSANITLLIPADTSIGDGATIGKATTYFGADSGHSSLTITNYFEDAIKLQATGVKVASMSLDNFSTGQIPSFSFSGNGLGYEESVEENVLDQGNRSAEPPLALEACVYMDGTRITVTDVSLSVDNTLGRITSTCEANGVKSQLTSGRAVSGSFTTYMDSADVNIFDKFDANSKFSLFLRAQNPTAVAGESKEHVGIYLPSCLITAQPKGDADGVITISVDFEAGLDDNEEDIFIGFI